MKIKSGRNVYELNEDDVIGTNGRGHWINTRKVRHGFNPQYVPVTTQRLNRMLKMGYLELFKEGQYYGVKYYRLSLLGLTIEDEKLVK